MWMFRKRKRKPRLDVINPVDSRDNSEVATGSPGTPLASQMALAPASAPDLFKCAPRDAKTQCIGLLEPAPAEPASLDRTDNRDLLAYRERDREPPPAADMRREDERLKTFAKWPVSFLRPQDLARSGFYYVGRGDEVRCAFCKVEIMRWEQGDDPAADHERWAPQCPLLRKRATGNVPLVGDGRDECGIRTPPPAPAADGGGGARLLGPSNPRYASESARLRSFADWPRSLRQKPEELAEAGFFYTGQGDKTKCFYCDGGLKDWEDDDVPWEQHARWFDRCAFVQLVKGKDYVKRVMSEQAAAVGPSEPPAPPAAPAPVAPAAPASPAPDDSMMCILCVAEERSVCFVPCGHVVACAKCALATDKCPMCRQEFTDAVRLYYS